MNIGLNNMKSSDHFQNGRDAAYLYATGACFKEDFDYAKYDYLQCPTDDEGSAIWTKGWLTVIPYFKKD